ncbi:hypothetical protein H5410_032000 [Solanum commersonii]|uniref:Uncharacterized protein n=1 Tax=Solanum commersonii TaxID=4109 RepID=A0A9J5YP22_SOLCO|nr:hypothetical protein H5410_032000 [Solanum commersonii]
MPKEDLLITKWSNGGGGAFEVYHGSEKIMEEIKAETLAKEQEIDGRGEEKSLTEKGRFLGIENVWGRRKFWEKYTADGNCTYFGKRSKQFGI